MGTVKVGLLGLGTVGGGTAAILKDNADEISRRLGKKVTVICAAVKSLNEEWKCDTDDIRVTEDAFDVVNDPDVDIVVELIGGDTFAKDLVMKAIENGKHVVTANKALIAKYGNEIFEKSSDAGVCVAYEAAVAGGIPIIKAMREGLAGNRVQWLAGIINGTGNFILTEMRDKGRDFADVLAEAQSLGYAEADPTFDVEGIDAAHKLTILASIAFGIPLSFENCYTEGISKITQADVEYAEQLGYRIKHLGLAVKTDQGVEMRVHPTLVPDDQLIANVNGVMNAVHVQSDQLGTSLYYGAGAGAAPTASAVVADILDITRSLEGDASFHVPSLAFQSDAIKALPFLGIEEIETAFFLRLSVNDDAQILSKIAQILGDNAISTEAIFQTESGDDCDASMIILTHRVLASKVTNALGQMKTQNLMGDVSCIRVEGLAP
jgi:homoserine dehydrogenase